MIFKRKTVVLALLTLTFIACAAFAAEQVSLFGDTINYDTNTRKVRAVGNVVLSRGRSRVYGASAEGSIGDSVFEFKGGITGTFPEYNAELKSADKLKWQDSNSESGDGQLEATGRVHLTRGASEYIKANYVLWVIGTDNYTARGNVDMHYDGRVLIAADVRRTSTSFVAKNVTRYEDKAQKTVMAAELVEGKTRNAVVEEIVATGSIAVNYTDQEGFKTVLTGDKAIYSRALDTIVVTGKAKAIRSDGKTVNADSMTLRVGPRKLEASGNAKITFTVEKKEGEKSKKTSEAVN